jgi:hypothetical protein
MSFGLPGHGLPHHQATVPMYCHTTSGNGGVAQFILGLVVGDPSYYLWFVQPHLGNFVCVLEILIVGHHL